MTLSVAIVATGEMGSALGRELRAGGARILTSLTGRGGASRERALAAGFEIIDDDDRLLAEAEILLSVVPPDQAVPLAERFAPALQRAARKPIYADCNAVAPQTARRIGEIVGASGAPFVDAGLFGGPTSAKPGVIIYASGEAAADFARLGQYGPQVKVMAGSTGAASAMKLSFAGINKGFTGLGAMVVLAALRAGAEPELAEQLLDAHPTILAYIARFVPAMYPKAYRWSPEMEEISAFMEEDEAAAELFRAMAKFYDRFGEKVAAGNDPDLARLSEFCKSIRK